MTDLKPLSEMAMGQPGEHSFEDRDEEMEHENRSRPNTSRLKGLRLVITLVGLCFAVFCVALDNTIIATAIPYITDQFKNLNDVGWYGSVYLLTTCAFQLLYGKLYKFFSIKAVFLTGLFIFEVGSLICGVAPSSISLIIGRAIAGLGSAAILSGAMIIIAHVQWAGTTYAWGNWRIIFLFIMFGVLLATFVAVQVWQGEAATVPPRIARERSVAFGTWFAICMGGTYYVFIYYLPIWFQAIKGVSPLRSGIDTLPMILGNVFGVISAGALTTRFGYYMPWIFLSLIFMSIGAGLLTTLKVDSSTAQWIGYQVLFGLGTGWGFQQTAVAAQTVLALVDIPIGTALMVFIQLLGGAMFVTIAQNIFTNHLVSGILAIQIPDLDPKQIVQSGATHLRRQIPDVYLPQVLIAYDEALVKTFQVALCLACLSLLGAVGMEWRSVKNKQIVAAVA
ncbi:MAG: hypothetical protein Q9191_002067 [Dirinaria sp. TL-2023a]